MYESLFVQAYYVTNLVVHDLNMYMMKKFYNLSSFMLGNDFNC